MLLAFVAVLVGIPSSLIFGPLGAAGTPAGVLGILLLVLVGVSRLSQRRQDRAMTPVLWVLLFYILAMLAAYAAGMLRPITAAETTSADRGLLMLASYAGIVLAISDGISTRERLDRFLKAVVLAGSVLAALGVLQFFLSIDIAKYIKVPGLTANHAVGGLIERAGFVRINATAAHPIEFGAVLTLILPIAIHYAFHAPRGNRKWPWLAVVLMGFAVPLTVARSAILGIAVVLLLLFFTWTGRQRRNAILLAPFAILLLKIPAPHLISTLLHLFTRAANDPSVQNRLGDYRAAGFYISRYPIIGHGYQTFLPQLYRTFDNVYLGVLVEAGVIGFTALVLLIVGPGLAALSVRKRSIDPVTRSLAYSLMVSAAVALSTFATFDAFSFPMATGIFFVIIGSISCLWRLERAPSVASVQAVPRRDTMVLSVQLMIGAAWLLVFAFALLLIRQVPPKYQAIGIIHLSGETATTANVYQSGPFLGDVPRLLVVAATGPDTRRKLSAEGHGQYEVVLGGGSLEPGTEDLGQGNLLEIGATAENPDAALATAKAVMQDITETLARWQAAAEAAPGSRIVPLGSVDPQAGEVTGRRTRAEAISFVLALMLSVLSMRAARMLVNERQRWRTARSVDAVLRSAQAEPGITNRR
jgi:O-antigen ligase